MGPLGTKLSDEILIMDLSGESEIVLISCNLMIFLGGLKDKNPIENSAFEKSPGKSRGSRGNGVTGRRTEPGKHAHAFRMTLVGKDKLPQNISKHWLPRTLIASLILRRTSVGPNMAPDLKRLKCNQFCTLDFKKPILITKTVFPNKLQPAGTNRWIGACS